MRIVIKKICVPTDFSPTAEYALRFAVGLAEPIGAELHLLHVLQDYGAYAAHPDFTASGDEARAYFNRYESGLVQPPGEPPPNPDATLNETAHEFLKALETGAQQQFAQLPVDEWWKKLTIIHATRFGNPVEEICHYARKHGIDLVVMGTHGRTGLKHLLIGSVAERVVRACSCPVLTVREHQHAFVTQT